MWSVPVEDGAGLLRHHFAEAAFGETKRAQREVSSIRAAIPSIDIAAISLLAASAPPCQSQGSGLGSAL